MASIGLTDDNKPMGSLLFVGPTGVGKTELARVLSSELGVHCYDSICQNMQKSTLLQN